MVILIIFFLLIAQSTEKCFHDEININASIHFRALQLEDFEAACRNHFCSGRLCLGFPQDEDEEEASRPFLFSQTPIPRRYSRACLERLDEGDDAHACRECLKMYGLVDEELPESELELPDPDANPEVVEIEEETGVNRAEVPDIGLFDDIDVDERSSEYTIQPISPNSVAGIDAAIESDTHTINPPFGNDDSVVLNDVNENLTTKKKRTVMKI